MTPDDGGPAGRKDILGDILSGAVSADAAQAILGKPVEVGSVRLVPIASYWFGGLGGQPGFAAAVGAVHPVAVAVVRGDDIAIYSLRGPGLAEQLKELLETVRGALTKDQVAGSTSGDPSGPSNPM